MVIFYLSPQPPLLRGSAVNKHFHSPQSRSERGGYAEKFDWFRVWVILQKDQKGFHRY
jgi:hypothetical protein